MNSPLLALDVGFRRTGVALSETGQIATPLTVLPATPPHMHAVIEAVISLIRTHGIQTVVVGLPLSQEGQPTAQSQRVEKVITLLQDRLDTEQLTLSIIRMNEFHSTRDAATLYPDSNPDAGAAALILQDYLDAYER